MLSDEEIVEEARKMVMVAKRKCPRLTGYKPSGLLAGAYYLLKMREFSPVSQFEAAEKFGVTMATVRKAKEALILVLNLPIEEWWERWIRSWREKFAFK
jgi:transcription initiation factor TFIIIB Brf1 subunit/transcription initiation factor TFIIB